jgi:PAS domain S-box-containing protein
MASRKVDTNQLAKLLREQKESVVRQTLAALFKLPAFRKKLLVGTSREEFAPIASEIYASLIPFLTSSPDSKGKTFRLQKSKKKYIEKLSLSELQQAQLILLEQIQAVVRKRFSKEPVKLETFLFLLSKNIQSFMLQSSKTDEKRRKKSQDRVENKYARLLNLANDAIVLVDFESGLFVEANKAACELTGYSEEELKQTGLNALVSVFDLNVALEKANDAVEQGAIRFDDLSIFTRSGKTVPVDISASAVLIKGKKHILAIMRDIKERKKFEQEIEQRAQRLQLLNEIARTISSADLDIEAVLTSILKSISGVIKVEAGSILKLDGEVLHFLAALGEKAECVKPFRLRLGQGIAGWAAEHGESLIVRNVHKDPRYFPLIEQSTGFVSRSILAVPMKKGDEVVGVIELINKIGGVFNKKDLELMQVISNVAAVALAHASLYNECKVARVRLSQLCSPQASSRLAGAVAQEMKDPLGIIKNYIKILDNRLSADATKGEEISVISEETDRLTNIINQLVWFSEAYSEEPKDTPLNLLIENTLASAREKLESTGIKTELHLQDALPAIPVIPNQMNMVFSNLVKLSIAEMPHGGILTVTTRRRDSEMCVEFTNSGGLRTNAEADELFSPSAVAKGLVPKGLGLYLVSSIIHGYGGDIRVGTGGEGENIFSISLPLKGAGPASEAPQ